jgi:hypothetical protein
MRLERLDCLSPANRRWAGGLLVSKAPEQTSAERVNWGCPLGRRKCRCRRSFTGGSLFQSWHWALARAGGDGHGREPVETRVFCQLWIRALARVARAHYGAEALEMRGIIATMYFHDSRDTQAWRGQLARLKGQHDGDTTSLVPQNCRTSKAQCRPDRRRCPVDNVASRQVMPGTHIQCMTAILHPTIKAPPRKSEFSPVGLLFVLLFFSPPGAFCSPNARRPSPVPPHWTSDPKYMSCPP